MSIPLPPGVEAPQTAPTDAEREQQLRSVRDELAKQNPDFGSGPQLTEDQKDTMYLLRKYLKPVHFNDNNILRLIRSYLLCRDFKQAAAEAGLEKRDARQLLNRPDIVEAIRRVDSVALMKHGFDGSEVVERVKEIMQVDLLEFEREDGTYKRLRELSPELRRAIKKIKVRNEFGKDPNGMDVVTGEIIEIELWDKMKSVELLGREKDLFKETRKHEHDISNRMASVLLEARDRAESGGSLPAPRDVGPIPVIPTPGHTDAEGSGE